MKTQAAKASYKIKKLLKKEYPNIKFSVRSDNFSMGSSVDISWEDGMPEDEIKSFAKQFQYGYFNGMDDSYRMTNLKDFPQVKFVKLERTLSSEVRDKIKNDLANLMNIEPKESSKVPEDYTVNIRDFRYGTPTLKNLIHRLSYNYDFTKGFNGVRKERDSEGDIIHNSFEIY